MAKNTPSLCAFLFGAAGLVTLLAACQPNAFPTGYTYHDQTYKSPTPPPSKKFTERQRATMGPAQADAMRLSVYDLVDRLTNRAGLPPKAVYVQTPEVPTPFTMNMDNDLRESLRHVGYRLADTPADAYVLSYSAETLTPHDGSIPDPNTPNMRLGLYVWDGVGEEARMLTQELGDYVIPGGEILQGRPWLYNTMPSAPDRTEAAPQPRSPAGENPVRKNFAAPMPTTVEDSQNAVDVTPMPLQD